LFRVSSAPLVILKLIIDAFPFARVLGLDPPVSQFLNLLIKSVPFRDGFVVISSRLTHLSTGPLIEIPPLFLEAYVLASDLVSDTTDLLAHLVVFILNPAVFRPADFSLRKLLGCLLKFSFELKGVIEFLLINFTESIHVSRVLLDLFYGRAEIFLPLAGHDARSDAF